MYHYIYLCIFNCCFPCLCLANRTEGARNTHSFWATSSFDILLRLLPYFFKRSTRFPRTKWFFLSSLSKISAISRQFFDFMFPFSRPRLRVPISFCPAFDALAAIYWVPTAWVSFGALSLSSISDSMLCHENFRNLFFFDFRRFSVDFDEMQSGFSQLWQTASSLL